MKNWLQCIKHFNHQMQHVIWNWLDTNFHLKEKLMVIWFKINSLQNKWVNKTNYSTDFSNYVIEAYKTKSKVQTWKSPPFRIYSPKCNKPVENFNGCMLKDHIFGPQDEKAPMTNLTKNQCFEICSDTKNCTFYSWNESTRNCTISSLKATKSQKIPVSKKTM